MAIAYSEDAREWAVERVLAGLRSGTPLTVICSAEGMPCDDTIRVWAHGDEDLSRAIARAREAGFDQIAMDALAIADDKSGDVKSVGRKGEEYEVCNTEFVQRAKLRIETRLKLLAKWDPKRYGEKLDVTSGGERINWSDKAEAARRLANGD